MISAPDFSLISQNIGPLGSDKFQNTAVYSVSSGKTYAVGVGGGSFATMAIFDITDQTSVSMLNYGLYAGAYNVSLATISNSTYAFLPSSGSSNLYIINITNPYSWSTVSTTLITNRTKKIKRCF